MDGEERRGRDERAQIVGPCKAHERGGGDQNDHAAKEPVLGTPPVSQSVECRHGYRGGEYRRLPQGVQFRRSPMTPATTETPTAHSLREAPSKWAEQHLPMFEPTQAPTTQEQP